MLDIVNKLFRSNIADGAMTVVLHCEQSYSAVLGQQRPVFSLVGPATRTAEALLDASPPGMHSATQAFCRLLSNSHIQLPRHEGDVVLDESTRRCRLRGAGLTRVQPLWFPIQLSAAESTNLA